MTCIVAVKNPEEGTVILGADGASSDGTRLLPTLTSKLLWRPQQNMVIGVSGSWTLLQAIRNMKFPPPISFVSPVLTRDWMEVEFRNTIIDQYLDHAPKANDDGDLLVGIAGQIFVVTEDFGVIEVDAPFWAAGSGMEYALGSLFSTPQVPPQLAARMALGAAAHFIPAEVGEPFTFMETKKK